MGMDTKPKRVKKEKKKEISILDKYAEYVDPKDNPKIGTRDTTEVRGEINDLNEKIRTLNRSKKAAEDDLKRPEKSELHEDLKEDIVMYEKKVRQLREQMVELQEYLPPIDYDALLSGEYKMQQLAELGGKREAVPLLTDTTLEKRDAATKPEFPYYRNIYWGDIKEIDGCGLLNFREK